MKTGKFGKYLISRQKSGRPVDRYRSTIFDRGSTPHRWPLALAIGKVTTSFLFRLYRCWASCQNVFWPSWLFKDIQNSPWASRKTYNWRENQEEEEIKHQSSIILQFSALSASFLLLPCFLVSFYYLWCIFLQLC